MSGIGRIGRDELAHFLREQGWENLAIHIMGQVDGRRFPTLADALAAWVPGDSNDILKEEWYVAYERLCIMSENE